jgi:hypothetical protein
VRFHLSITRPLSAHFAPIFHIADYLPRYFTYIKSLEPRGPAPAPTKPIDLELGRTGRDGKDQGTSEVLWQIPEKEERDEQGR